MPTQEERLTALEQTFATFQKEIASHIQATDENTTIMLGVIRHQGQDIKRIVQRLETIDQRLEIVDKRLNTIEQRLDQLETKVDQRLDRLETKSNEHTELLHQILARLPKTP
jgi:septation ring formation regulator EzrA